MPSGALILFTATASADEILYCRDGDFCRAVFNGKLIKLRVKDIDTPEVDQPYWEEARDYMMKLVAGRSPSLGCDYDARTKRHNCSITLDGVDIAGELVKRGLAWDYPGYSRGRYRQAEMEARKQRLGIWSEQTPVSPYCWRKPQATGCENLQYQP